DIELELMAGRGDPEQADDPGGPGARERLRDKRWRTGALHQDIGAQALDDVAATDVVGTAQGGNQLGFVPIVLMIENMELELPLRSQQGRQQADRAGAGDQQGARTPGGRALPDMPSMIPG